MFLWHSATGLTNVSKHLHISTGMQDYIDARSYENFSLQPGYALTL